MKTVKKDPPRKPIYVGNPNDPRLKAYQDSLGRKPIYVSDPNDPRLKAYQAGKLVMENASRNRARNRGKK
jgi:hypothetical protein